MCPNSLNSKKLAAKESGCYFVYYSTGVFLLQTIPKLGILHTFPPVNVAKLLKLKYPCEMHT